MTLNLSNSLICAFKRNFPSTKTFRLNKNIYSDFNIDLSDSISVGVRVFIPSNFFNTTPRVKVIDLKKNNWIRTFPDWHVYDGKEMSVKGELCYVLPLAWKEKMQECTEAEGSTIKGIADFAVKIIERDCRYLLSVHWNNRYNSSNKWPKEESEWLHGEEGVKQWKKERENKKQ